MKPSNDFWQADTFGVLCLEKGTFKNNFTAILMRSLGIARLFTVGIADNHALVIFLVQTLQ